MSKIKSRLLKFIIILIIGGLGGIIADCFIMPYLANISFISGTKFAQKIKSGTTIINKTEEIVITENTAAENAINKINSCLVVVQVSKGNKMVKQGSGVIVTNDGLILTANDLVSSGLYNYQVILSNGTLLDGKIIRRDISNNLALIKIEANNLSVISLGSLDSLHLGQMIILIGAQINQNSFYRFANIGTIRGVSDETLAINLDEINISANGGPLINIKGEMIGINIMGYNGLIKTVPAKLIADFLQN